MQQLTAPAAPLYWTNGRFEVEIQTPRSGVHNVVVSHARPCGTRIDELSAPIPSPALARTIARVITLSLRNAPPTANAIKAVDNARRAVLDNIDGQLKFVTAGSTAADTLRAQIIQDVRALYTSPEDQDAADRTAADLNATLDERAANQPQIADEAADYLNRLTAQRQERIDAAVKAADNQPAPTRRTFADLVGHHNMINAPRLRTNTPSARKLSQRMTDMLIQLHHNAQDDRSLTVITAREQTTARALRRRGLVNLRQATSSSMDVWLRPGGAVDAARLAGSSGTKGVAA